LKLDSHKIPAAKFILERRKQRTTEDNSNSSHNSHYNSTPNEVVVTMGLTASSRSNDPEAQASQDVLVLHNYYQHNPQQEECLESSALTTWKICDFGTVGELSRDGSVHATDEVFNAASHLAATLLSVLASALLIAQSSAMGAPWKIVSFSIYGASLIFLFSVSTLHHGLMGPKSMEEFLRMMDYLAIYPLIAGTFTPLCLVFYHDSIIGWTFCSVVWGLAILGMIFTATSFSKIPKWLSMTLYITLGWLGACMSYWFLPILGYPGFSLFFVGGVLYTIGG
jgi:hemolysin III